ncbi:MAG: acetylornithine transaminase [Abditibacteriota bacterium]|nr:acetylornithine transaminase [Abditibacteriota bacterium]
MKDITRTIIERDDTWVMHTYGRFPMVLEKGSGVYVYDTEGRCYLDMVAGIAVNMLGYGDRELSEAIARQAATLMHTSNLFYTEPQGRLAEWLARAAGMKRAFFCNSGAEANEAALKLARKAAKRDGRPGDKTQIIAALNSFHGRTLGAITATGQTKYQKSFTPLVPDFDYIEYNDAAALEAAMSERTCAVILEPIQGESGVRPATGEFLEAVRRLCDKYDAAMILDEVQTGMGRTGRTFAFEHYGVKPDIVTLAKMLGGGFPIGACIAGEKYADVFAPGDHASTFGGNPLACAAALAVIGRYERDRLGDNAAAVGARLMEKLSQTQGIDLVRGKGLMIGLVLSEPVAKKTVTEGFGCGVILNAIGDSIIRLVPPLILTAEQADEAADKIGRAIAAAAGK